MSRRQIAFGVLIFILLIFLGLGGYYYYGTLSASAVPSGSYLGCYKDDVNRVLTKKHGLMTWGECRAKAQQAGDSYFGMQYAEDTLAKPDQAQCLSGSDSYSRLGAATSCSAKDSSGRTLGAAWSNAVYKS